ncbi:MAG: DUF1778 domain-containing protein [Synergistaceae bacterium]|jgi:uncharacterized protein (DUF1778 family)|nr:DUF1778 domain-containing protein [Synergistaceae bacterium]
MLKQGNMVKDARVEMRIPQSLKEVWQYAAAMRGNSLAEYIIGTVSDRAAKDVEQQHIIHLTVRDQMALLEALEAPEREPNERAKKAMNDYHKAIEDGDLVVRH